MTYPTGMGTALLNGGRVTRYGTLGSKTTELVETTSQGDAKNKRSPKLTEREIHPLRRKEGLSIIRLACRFNPNWAPSEPRSKELNRGGREGDTEGSLVGVEIKKEREAPGLVMKGEGSDMGVTGEREKTLIVACVLHRAGTEPIGEIGFHYAAEIIDKKGKKHRDRRASKSVG